MEEEFPTDFKKLRAFIIEKMKEKNGFTEYYVNCYFDGIQENYDNFLKLHSRNGEWTDDMGLMCSVS